VRYTLDWGPEPFDRMNAIVRGHPAHTALLAALLRDISAALGTDPGNAGESRAENDRLAFFGPLAVSFRVLHADRRVLILDVYLTSFLL
jgi:hypothetical protein